MLRAVSMLDSFSIELATAAAGMERDAPAIHLADRPWTPTPAHCGRTTCMNWYEKRYGRRLHQRGPLESHRLAAGAPSTLSDMSSTPTGAIRTGVVCCPACVKGCGWQVISTWSWAGWQMRRSPTGDHRLGDHLSRQRTTRSRHDAPRPGQRSTDAWTTSGHCDSSPVTPRKRPLSRKELAGIPIAAEHAALIIAFHRYHRHNVRFPDPHKSQLHVELIGFVESLASLDGRHPLGKTSGEVTARYPGPLGRDR
jgi:hypothetical protein